MARSRLDLDKELRVVLDECNIPRTASGKYHLYWQPTNNTKLSYPCIIYNYPRLNAVYADNSRYLNYGRYSILIIRTDQDDDRLLKTMLGHFKYCSQDRETYVADNLYHDPLTLYY